MKKNLVLVGGGHAHLTVLLNLASHVQRGDRVTLTALVPTTRHQYGTGDALRGSTVPGLHFSRQRDGAGTRGHSSWTTKQSWYLPGKPNLSLQLQ